MTPNQQGSTSRAAWLASKLVTLPMPAADGSPLACRVRPLAPLKLLACLKRLPGAFGKTKTENPENEGLPEPVDAQAVLEDLDSIELQIAEMRPMIRAIVEAGVVEPRISFDEPHAEDAVPWEEINMQNQVAMFRAVLEASRFTNGGAAEEVAGFRVPRKRRILRGVGGVRRGAPGEAQAVRGVPVPRDRGRPRKEKR